jgi:hypothetical protein
MIAADALQFSAWVAPAVDGVDDAASVVLGPTIVVMPDGSRTKLTEREALAVPWRCTGGSVSIGPRECSALAWPDAVAARSIGQALWLTDGQCLVGTPELRADDAAAGTIRWRAGPIVQDIPLSGVRAWTAASVAPPTGSVDADRVTLRNGDIVEGLVTRLGADVTIDVDGAPRTVDAELVSSVQFVEAGGAPAAAPRLRLWRDDGTIIDVESLERDGTMLRIALPATPTGATPMLRWRIDELLGLSTPALSLGGLALRSQGAPAVVLPGMQPEVRMQGPGRLGSMDATLLGPGSWSMSIASQGMLIGEAIVPDRVRAIADHSLVIRQAGVELARIEARTCPCGIRVPTAPGTVEFELVPGKAGPVGCMVELVDLVQVTTAP